MCQPDCMCNLYSITTNVEAIRRLFAVDRMGWQETGDVKLLSNEHGSVYVRDL